jgi:haloalkane dehalogenase
LFGHRQSSPLFVDGPIVQPLNGQGQTESTRLARRAARSYLSKAPSSPYSRRDSQDEPRAKRASTLEQSAMSNEAISPTDPHPRKRLDAAGVEMAYVDTGAGDPIVFLHGNPTSSYLWRNIIPHLAPLARCLAPDLVGMGDSGKAPDGSYRFADHARYLDAWFAALGLERQKVTLVMHDWGSALGFNWARRNPGAVKGLAYMEALVRPRKWSDWPEAAQGVFRSMRSPAGEEIILKRNLFVERILPASVIRKLGEAEMETYRRPFREPGESRRPMLTWPREIPIDGEPADVTALVEQYSAWLGQSAVPKLFINADPGSILTGTQREFCRKWPNQREITVKGIHFIQEDSPHEIGRALADWSRGL